MSWTIWWAGSHSRPMALLGTASNISSQALGLKPMLQVALFQVPSMGQFSMHSFTPLSSARLASSPKTSLYRGMAFSTGWPSRAPAKVVTRLVPNRWALSIKSSKVLRWASFSRALQ